VSHIPLEGNLNLRDLGGYEAIDGRIVQSGCLFRSDELHTLTDTDLDVIAHLGVRVVFDLRNDAERASRPSRLPAAVELHERRSPSKQPAAAARTLEADIVSGWISQRDESEFDAERARVYVDMLTHLAPEFRRIVELASEAAQRPLLFHCMSGKDRTGVAAAILLGLLGVPDVTIIDDYELTRTYATEKRFAGVAHVVEQHGANPDQVRRFISPCRPAIEAAITQIHEQWGGYDAYAMDCLNVSAEVPARLRGTLLA
jgi:protein-tyrosine phosphatase